MNMFSSLSTILFIPGFCLCIVLTFSCQFAVAVEIEELAKKLSNQEAKAVENILNILESLDQQKLDINSLNLLLENQIKFAEEELSGTENQITELKQDIIKLEVIREWAEESKHITHTYTNSSGAYSYAALKAEAEIVFEEGVKPFMKQYCTYCHDNRRSKAGLNLDASLKFPGGSSSSKHWKLAVAKVKAYNMPPINVDKVPSDEERQQFLEWMSKVKYLSPKDPGPFIIRRLSKVEYSNSLRDLYGVDPNITDDLPEEVFGAGYLNSISPLQSEQYLSIANKVLDQIFTNKDKTPSKLQSLLFNKIHTDETDFQTEARKVAHALARDAYRRPPSEAELDVLVEVFDLGRNNGLDYLESLGLMLKAILVSPQFLFITPVEKVDSEKTIVPLDDYQLATRLSYLLWMSPPDDELSAVADQGKLQEPEILRDQVKRMLRDSRSKALFDGFGAQWLGLDKLEDKTFDTKLYPQMTPETRKAMVEEARLFFESILEGNQSVVGFIDNDYTFLNGAIAKLYGLEESVKGPEMRRVKLKDPNRGGILGMPGVLATSSLPNRTSPVRRGVWVLEKVLGEHVPPPPPDVPELEEQSQQSVEGLSLRERTELHQNDPLCSSCHSILDPIGFGLENYDAIGRWRERDELGGQIDASGKLLNGETFDNPTELKQLIASDKVKLARNVTERLMSYALCRQLEGYDEVVIDQLMVKIAKDDYRIQTIITEVVTSYLFTQRRIKEQEWKGLRL